MKQPVRIAAEWLTGIGLLLIGQTALAADSQCPDGQFNPYQTVCMCPNGGYVGPGERCSRKSSNQEPVLTKRWGAIAIDMSKEQKSAGYSHSTLNQAEANRKALASCKLSTCKVVLTFQNSCGAIAIGGKGEGIWGGAVNIYENKVMQQAADACYDKGAKDCYKWVTPQCAGSPVK